MRLLVFALLLSACGEDPPMTKTHEDALCRAARGAYAEVYGEQDRAQDMNISTDRCAVQLFTGDERAGVVIDLRWTRTGGGRTATWRRDWTCTADRGGPVGWALKSDTCWMGDRWLDAK